MSNIIINIRLIKGSFPVLRFFDLRRSLTRIEHTYVRKHTYKKKRITGKQPSKSEVTDLATAS